MDIVNILVSSNINYCLADGTLLGAIRNSELIPYDSDEDIMIFDSDKELFDSSIKLKLKEYNFKIIRANSDCISIFRNNSYIDIELVKFDTKTDLYYY